MTAITLHEARALGTRLAESVSANEINQASELLLPVLQARTPFRLLDVIGVRLGAGPVEPVNRFLDRLAAQRTMGGWIVIASTLRQQLVGDLPGAFERARAYAIAADAWYAADSIGERVPGPALVNLFEPALAGITPWRIDGNCWVRRMGGVAVHFWAKRARGQIGLRPQVETLLELLSPLFSEDQMDAAKGVGWGLKTLGRYYPDLVADWLIRQGGRRHRALILRKATLYMPPELRDNVFDKFR